jgi:hypothetical protein
MHKLIAGPGVYICDECIGLCQDILASSSSDEAAEAAEAAFENRPAPEILQLLPVLDRTIGSIESDLARWVARLRTAGTSWDDIATSLGANTEAVVARFERTNS